MGSNSTRLLVADVDGTDLTEVERISTVTRLGRGVDTTGRLATEAIEDVCDSVGGYLVKTAGLDVDTIAAVATSAVRDAENGAMFLAELRERFDLDATILDGAAEARATYVGTRSGVADGGENTPTLVIDIGGGSTELVVGVGDDIIDFVSLQVGTVRHTERHVRSDPPAADELDRLAGDVGEAIAEATSGWRQAPIQGIAVAGTPTSLAAIDQGLVPYDPDRVHGYTVSLAAIQRLYSMLATKTLAERLEVPGLHPGRAPTIVAGVVILIQVMRSFNLDAVRVSEHDILYGVAIEAAAKT